MKAVGFQTRSDPEILAFEEAPTRKLSEREVLVRVKRAAGVKRHDTWVTQLGKPNRRANSVLLRSSVDGDYAVFVKAPSENVPHSSREFPLESALEENRTLEMGQQFGKLLLLP